MIVLYGWILWFSFLQKKVNFVLLEGIQNTDIISRCSVNPLHGQVHLGGVVEYWARFPSHSWFRSC